MNPQKEEIIMIKTTTWKHNFSNYDNLDHINANGHQHLEIFQPFESKKIRLQLNNLYGETPLVIDSLEIYTNSKKKVSVTKDGKKSFAVESRLVEWSDWIDFNLPADSYLSVDIVSPTKAIHTLGLTISNDLIRTENSDPKETKYFFGISEIQVKTEHAHKRIALFGDSLTNQGNYAAPLSIDLEKEFHCVTANYGISGNRLLHPGHSTSQWSTSFGEAGFTRFDHMIAEYQPNIVIFMEGVNDLLHPGTGAPINELPTVNALVKAVHALKKKCKKHGITFVPMTITPAYGNINGGVFAWSEEKEKIRLAVNHELLKMPHIIDIADFVSNDDKLKPEFDYGDHVHLSNEGGKQVAKFVEEQLIRKRMV
ncbi:hypothetical protein LKACC16343_00716 [Companilactobacillus bobalius]|uniref:SGNH hydrolase-type esterase domain-containing protein n=3 Tax=Companilactobacillus bobalius TaxID=2801451 RepID=A0A202FDN6_9LACO|nr:GDSL family lipase [Companilactobacillus bobalius DSM 19674]OVE98560.1 hypothetical protein LKACC16343_00716 [Companilactobacillus bobalius]